jgi:hypothetical protein
MSISLQTNGLKNITPIDVNIEFQSNLSREGLLKKVQQLGRSQVIFWYIGENGIAGETVNYYSKYISALSNRSVCWLYDLTAWRALKSKERSLTTTNPNVEVINGHNLPNCRALPSSDFFRWIQQENNPEVNSYIKDVVLKNPFVVQASKNYQYNRSIGEVFETNCPILEEQYGEDAGKIYSALQYIEAIYLIERLVKVELQNLTQAITIVFALPNDESKYYQNKEGSFAKDLTHLLREKLGTGLCGKTISIKFYAFKYLKTKDRPYNAGGLKIASIAKEKLMPEEKFHD